MSDIKRDPKSQTGGMGHQLTAAPDVELTPDQLRVLLFDEWEKSCMLFPGGSDWLKTLAEYPFNYKLPKLLDVAIKSWWVWGVPQSPGMRQIARYMLDRWDD